MNNQKQNPQEKSNSQTLNLYQKIKDQTLVPMTLRVGCIHFRKIKNETNKITMRENINVQLQLGEYEALSQLQGLTIFQKNTQEIKLS